jgi:hypothetical protein
MNICLCVKGYFLVSRRRKCQRMAHTCIKLKYNLMVERRQTKAQDVVQVTNPSSDFSEGNKGIKQSRTKRTRLYHTCIVYTS